MIKAGFLIVFATFAVLLHTGCRSAVEEISGKVTLKGTPPPEKIIDLDYASARFHTNGLTTRFYLVSSNGGLPNVFVCIRAGLRDQTFAPDLRPVIMEARGAQFEPYVFGVRTNQPVRFRNTTAILDNVHVTPRNPGNREINFTMTQPAAQGPSDGKDFSFAVPEAFVRVKTDVHPWQFAYICVVDHPFFAVTDANGRFQFPPGLPPGKYTIEARHLKAGAVTQEVVLGRGEKKKLEFTLDVPKPLSR